jgi:hypothetical protein
MKETLVAMYSRCIHTARAMGLSRRRVATLWTQQSCQKQLQVVTMCTADDNVLV